MSCACAACGSRYLCCGSAICGDTVGTWVDAATLVRCEPVERCDVRRPQTAGTRQVADEAMFLRSRETGDKRPQRAVDGQPTRVPVPRPAFEQLSLEEAVGKP